MYPEPVVFVVGGVVVVFVVVVVVVTDVATWIVQSG
jgi:hypothetical protein